MLDLSSARRALWKYGSSVPYSTATVTDIGEFDFRLMQVVERFFTLGTWRNMWRRLDLAIYDDRLTIPRGFDTCRQVSTCCGTVPLYSQFHRACSWGVSVDPAILQDGSVLSSWGAGLRLIDENAQTFRVPTGTFTLRAVATEVNATGLTLIGGFDQNSSELFGEITLALINGASNTTQRFTKLPEIQKAVTSHPVLLYSVDTTTAVATLIASYAPGETVPTYRQYAVSGIASTDTDPPTVSAICKLAFAPAVAANDIVIPGMVGALKLGLQSIQFEDRVDPQNAKIYMDNAIGLLDAELEELQSAEIPAVQFGRDFACGSIRNAR